MKRQPPSRKSAVYWIRFPSHSDPATQGYVGFTVQKVGARFIRHLDSARNRLGACPMLERILRKSKKAVVVETLLVGEAAYCLEIERTLRPHPHIGWNLSPGGSASGLGMVRSPESQARITASKIGKTRSPETRARISAALKNNKCALGSIHTPAMRAAHSARMKGYRHTPEAIEKIRAANLRRYL